MHKNVKTHRWGLLELSIDVVVSLRRVEKLTPLCMILTHLRFTIEKFVIASNRRVNLKDAGRWSSWVANQ